MSDSKPESAANLLALFGDPLEVHSPDPGKTGCGVLVSIVLALLSMLPLIEMDKHGIWRPLGASAFLAVPSFALAYYVWRKRKWKLLLCRHGVIQEWASGTEALLWSEVRVVSARRSGSASGPLVELTLLGRTSKIHIGGVVNYSDWRHLLETVLKAAQERGIPVTLHIDRSE